MSNNTVNYNGGRFCIFYRNPVNFVSGLYPEVGESAYLPYLVQWSPEILGAVIAPQDTLVTTITAWTERNRSMVAPSKAVTAEWNGIRLSVTRPESLPEWPQPSRSNLLKRSMWESFRSKRNYADKWYRWDTLVASCRRGIGGTVWFRYIEATSKTGMHCIINAWVC